MKAVTFDIFGTLLVPSDPDAPRKAREQQITELEAFLGRQKDDITKEKVEEAYLAAWQPILVEREKKKIDLGISKYIRTFLEYLGFKDANRRITRRIEAIFINSSLDIPFTPVPGVEDVLQKLKEREYILGLIENTGFSPGLVLSEILDTHKLGDYFDIKIYSSDIGFLKPHFMIFKATLKKLECEGESVVHIGDNYSQDVEGAKRSGWKAIWYNPKNDPVPDAASEEPDAIITNMNKALKAIRQLS